MDRFKNWGLSILFIYSILLTLFVLRLQAEATDADGTALEFIDEVEVIMSTDHGVPGSCMIIPAGSVIYSTNSFDIPEFSEPFDSGFLGKIYIDVRDISSSKTRLVRVSRSVWRAGRCTSGANE